MKWANFAAALACMFVAGHKFGDGAAGVMLFTTAVNVFFFVVLNRADQ